MDDWAVLVLYIFTAPPICASPPIPTPPVTTNAPVVELAEIVVLVNWDVAPPTLIFPAIPTPPDTRSAPVIVEVETVVAGIITFPPIYWISVKTVGTWVQKLCTAGPVGPVGPVLPVGPIDKSFSFKFLGLHIFMYYYFSSNRIKNRIPSKNIRVISRSSL